jgi:hypothetical protein
MIVDLKTADEIDFRAYSSLPLESNIIEKYRLGDGQITVAGNPGTSGDDGLTVVDYAFFAKDAKGKVKVVLSFERTDLRMLSQALSVPYRELQEEYGTRSAYSAAHVVFYSAEGKEDYGVYGEETRKEALFPNLLDMLLDVLDTTLDPEPIK